MKLIVIFWDDSTLIFSNQLRHVFKNIDIDVQMDLACYLPDASLSRRQIQSLIPGQNYAHIENAQQLRTLFVEGDYDAVLVNRVERYVREILKNPVYRDNLNRTKIIAFLPGLEFFPERGLKNRAICDGVFLHPKDYIEYFHKNIADSKNTATDYQIVEFGHPAFLIPAQRKPSSNRDIYFFTQAISPKTLFGREHIAKILLAIARRYRDRKVWIKLRHRPDENISHLHKEKFSYPSILAAIDNLPPNLLITDCTMDEALSSAGIAITCTSTAAIDAIREGVPTMIYVDYADNFLDPMSKPMRRLFAESGLIKTLEEILALDVTDPNPDWIKDMFCERKDLSQKIVDVINRLNQN